MRTNEPSSNESQPLSKSWPESRRVENIKPRPSALPRIPKKKEKGFGSVKISRGKPRNRRSEILRRLDVDEEALSQHPQIAPLLRMNGIRPERLVEVLRCDSNPESMTFVRKYDELTPAGRNLAGLEAIAVSTGLLPRRLWELFAGAALVQSKELVAVRIAMSLPEVMAVTIREAKKAEGWFDREHLFKSARILPTPKGSTTIINMGKPESEESTEEYDETKGDLEPADGFVLNAAKVMNLQKALPPKRALDEVEEVEEVEE